MERQGASKMEETTSLYNVLHDIWFTRIMMDHTIYIPLLIALVSWAGLVFNTIARAGKRPY